MQSEKNETGTVGMLCVVALMRCGNRPPATGTAPPRPRLTFTAAQAAMPSHVTELVETCTPRDAGAGAEGRALDHDRLAERNVDVRIDRFTDLRRAGKPFFNVLATIPGTGDGWIVHLALRYDERHPSKGFQAPTTRSSTGLLIELAMILRAADPLRATSAAHGRRRSAYSPTATRQLHDSRRLAKQIEAEGHDVETVICRGHGRRPRPQADGAGNTAALRLLALKRQKATGDRARIGLFDGIIYDDHQTFLDLRLPAVNLIDFEFGNTRINELLALGRHARQALG